MSPLALRVAIVWIAVVMAVSSRRGVAAEEQPGIEKKPDWAALESLFKAGDYGEVVVMADDIAVKAKRRSRDRDYVPRTIDFIRARMWSGFADLRLGRLDAAEAAFVAAYRGYKDSDFQRSVSLEARQGGSKVAAQLIILELTGIELLNARMKVILDRLRQINFERPESGGASEEPDAHTGEEVARWLEELRSLKRIAASAAESAAERFDKADPNVLSSPHSRTLVGQFWPLLIDGVTALELSRAGLDVSPVKKPETAAVAEGSGAPAAMDIQRRTDLRNEALEHFRKAAAALDEAVTAAKPKSGGLKPEYQGEAAAMEEELLANRGIARMEAGDLAGARDDVSRALQLHREAMTLRKTPRPDSHPDLFWPLLLAADVALAESHQRFTEGQAKEAQAMADDASKTLARAADLAVAENHPLRGYLAKLEARCERQRSAVERLIPRSEEADSAARALRGAIDATALPGIAL